MEKLELTEKMITNGTLTYSAETKVALLELLKEQKRINDLVDSIKEQIKTDVADMNAESLDLGGCVKVQIKKAHTQKKFNTTKFKIEQPELYEKYSTESEVKGSLVLGLDYEKLLGFGGK